jgi:uncharacterized NAD(P)/FAD-binding protein YdhS
VNPVNATSVIVGGGLSGALVAIHLLKRAEAGTRIVLIERCLPAGPGVAYRTDCPVHLLNVPAERMSLFAEDPDHFLRWAQARARELGFGGRVAGAEFLPRSLFGHYVAETLAEATAAARSGVSLEVVTGEVIDLAETPVGARLILGDGREFTAQGVALTLGNLPGEYPIQRPLRFYRGPRYVHIPWLPGLLANISQDDDVLIVGAGLTAIDIIVQLDQLGHRGTIHALSRRGLHPLAHNSGREEYPAFLENEPLPKTVLGILRRVRAEIRVAAAEGVDWRAVLDAIRPQSQSLWLGLSLAERKRFLRHVRPFWEVHRHRLAPETAALVERLAAAGRVRFIAGRLDALHDELTGAEAVYRLRGTGQLRKLRAAKVINCTGPRTDYSKYQHPLLINLLARGLIDHDPLALGLNALPTGEVLRYRSGPIGWLFTLGAPLKGVLWESTAVSEIRVHAPWIAERLLALAPPRLVSSLPAVR